MIINIYVKITITNIMYDYIKYILNIIITNIFSAYNTYLLQNCNNSNISDYHVDLHLQFYKLLI